MYSEVITMYHNRVIIVIMNGIVRMYVSHPVTAVFLCLIVDEMTLLVQKEIDGQ